MSTKKVTLYSFSMLILLEIEENRSVSTLNGNVDGMKHDIAK